VIPTGYITLSYILMTVWARHIYKKDRDIGRALTGLMFAPLAFAFVLCYAVFMPMVFVIGHAGIWVISGVKPTMDDLKYSWGKLIETIL
jgi:hypothetical protein